MSGNITSNVNAVQMLLVSELQVFWASVLQPEVLTLLIKLLITMMPISIDIAMPTITPITPLFRAILFIHL